jgi:hypothetical protein
MTYRADIDALAARKQALDTEVEQKTRERDDAARLLAEATERLRLPVLDNIRVAAPCKADWNQMVGDDRVRHCAQCDQDVFNLSAMTREEAEALIRDKRGELCARYYRRADGTILTQDCPTGLRRRGRIVAIATAGTMASLAGVATYGVMVEERRHYTMGSIEAPPHAPAERLEAIQGGVSMPMPASVLPAECEQYRTQIREIEQCGQLPADVSRTLDQAWNDLERATPQLTPEALTAVRDACKTASESLAQAKPALCKRGTQTADR